MGLIIKLTDPRDGWDYYLDWSTVVDAPKSWGANLETFKRYYKHTYGQRALDLDFPARMERVEAKGTSDMMASSAEEVIACNRAGESEETLTYEGILDQYCRTWGRYLPEKSVG